MEKFGIYQILQALGGLSSAQTEKEQASPTQTKNAPAESPAPAQGKQTENAVQGKTSFLPPPSYFNARMLEIMNRHEEISRRISEKYEKRN